MIKENETLGEYLARRVVHQFGEDLRQVHPSWVQKLVQEILGEPKLMIGTDSALLRTIANVLATAFIGMDEEFSPHADLTALPNDLFERFMALVDERSDGSEGPFLWFQAERAFRRGKCSRPWEFVRRDTWSGTCRSFLKEKQALVEIDMSLGAG